MTKLNKAFAIRQYIEAHPDAKAPEVAKETGTHIAYVYAIQQKMRSKAKKKAAAASAPSKGQEVLKKVISEDEEQIANLAYQVRGLLQVNEMQQTEIQRLCTIIQYLEKFVVTSTRVEAL